MRYATILAAGTALAAIATAPVSALAADDAAVKAAPETAIEEVIVTARQREEKLKDVPVAVTAVSADFLRDKQIYAVKDIAAYAPGLNINSDSVGRAFISIRGVGTTLINTVQPGVGIFIDGVYQPDTSYLNSPLVDVERVEVLRGPQGTLFGNNTLGGAINVITRLPSNQFQGRIDAVYAGTDNFESVSGSVSGPLVKDVLQARIGAAYHQQDGFEKNGLIGGNADPLKQASVNGTIRFTPAPWASFILNGDYNRVSGGSTAYVGVTGPTDYSEIAKTNHSNLATDVYKGVDLKGVFDVASLKTTLTAIGAYNRRDQNSTVDGDYSPVDFLRATGTSVLQTYTGELRADTHFSDRFSTLFGAFVDRSTTDSATTTSLVLLGVNVPATDHAVTEQEAVYGTGFLKITDTLDFSAGLRYDHQSVSAASAKTAATYKADNLEPRFTLTEKWTPDFMTYASVARGVRGGGQNGPGAPNLLYKGDSVWTYELGTKFAVLDRRLTIDADVFYNDYSDFIGQNSLAPSTSGAGFVAINLNTGHVTSYGAELEAHALLTRRWRVDGGLTLLHARITNDAEYFAVTGTHVSSNRLIFTPDWNFNLDTSYTLPLGPDDVVFDAGVVGKGSRPGSSLDPNTSPILSAYYLANGSVTWKHNAFQVSLFANNLFNEKYIESYIDKSALVRAGLAFLAQDLAIQGDRRRYGVRVGYRF